MESACEHGWQIGLAVQGLCAGPKQSALEKMITFT